MQSIGSAAGFCQKHQMDKMFVGLEDATEPTCIKCTAESTPKLGRTQSVEDPGEDYFKGKGSNAKITTLDATHGGKVAVPSVTSLGKLPVSVEAKFEDHIENALQWLKSVPMPKDIKQFKSLQKSITILESLLEKANG